jgi:hypothetical protein
VPTGSGIAADTFQSLELVMKAKRRSPVTGPLLTFGLMVASVVAVVAISRVFDTRQKAAAEPAVQAVAASASDSSNQNTRQ